MEAETRYHRVALFDLSWECVHWATQFFCCTEYVHVHEWNACESPCILILRLQIDISE